MTVTQNTKTLEEARHMAEVRKDEFYDYLRLESVSTEHKQIPETVAYVKDLIEQTGGEVKVLDDLGGHPVIYGYFPASSVEIAIGRYCSTTIMMCSQQIL